MFDPQNLEINIWYVLDSCRLAKYLGVIDGLHRFFTPYQRPIFRDLRAEEIKTRIQPRLS